MRRMGYRWRSGELRGAWFFWGVLTGFLGMSVWGFYVILKGVWS